MSSKVMASFSAFGNDFPSIVLIVLHSLEVSTNCLYVFLQCSFIVLVIICCRAGEVGSLRSSRALILSNISAGSGSVLIRYVQRVYVVMLLSE